MMAVMDGADGDDGGNDDDGDDHGSGGGDGDDVTLSSIYHYLRCSVSSPWPLGPLKPIQTFSFLLTALWLPGKALRVPL